MVMIPGVVADTDFLRFGYWVEETTTDDETTYAINTFFGGSERV